MRAIETGIRAAAAAILALGLAAAPAGQALAQTANRVDAKKDWSVFVGSDRDGKLCWIASRPTASVALRDGKPVSVRRGDIFLMVSVRPTRGVKNEVSMLSGYPFKPGSKVKARVGSSEYEMFTKGEGAWLSSAKEDDRMVADMKRGATAVLTGVSSRGTVTKDTFSLLGFTAALAEAQARCK
ncbi:invasion associated locus B family protein [Oceanicella actignis]|uniref:Invasion protein IalB, involved in pathogenesis n=1 Tax=Oceanicella actignis TaxID=1189325 RepID=A0A1M7TF14_9RHOB|nr:invasion associated locus B family protein [Oceanicella actignis]SET61425.1 hypothetical protein SAMN04488119_106144 [Oceanicella actignis]SHN69349.1 hypothetical protein SAMN05216200_10658 [Oceanicella actignis]